MVQRVNRQVTDYVISYDNYLWKLFIEEWNKSCYCQTVNLIKNEAFRLFKEIQNNFYLDINSLSVYMPEYDWQGYPNLKKHTRSSCESYYNIFLLNKDERYINILKYNSSKKKLTKKESKIAIEYIKEVLPEHDFGKMNYITIKEKAMIAKQYEIEEETQKILKEYGIYSNSLIHSDIYYEDDEDRNELGKTLMKLEVLLLTIAYEQMFLYLNEKFGFNFQVDLTVNYNDMKKYIRDTPFLIDL